MDILTDHCWVLFSFASVARFILLNPTQFIQSLVLSFILLCITGSVFIPISYLHAKVVYIIVICGWLVSRGPYIHLVS